MQIVTKYWNDKPGLLKKIELPMHEALSPEALVAWDRDTDGLVHDIESIDVMVVEPNPRLWGLFSVCLQSGGHWRYVPVCGGKWIQVSTNRYGDATPEWRAYHAALSVVHALMVLTGHHSRHPDWE